MATNRRGASLNDGGGATHGFWVLLAIVADASEEG